MLSVWYIYIAAAFTASTVLVLAGLRSRAVAKTGGNGRHLPNSVHVPCDPLSDAGSAGDAAEAIAVALTSLQTAIHDQRVHVVVAAEPGLLVHARSGDLAAMVTELLRVGVDAVPGGQLLLTAHRQGERVDIALSDDGARADADLRQSLCRQLTDRAALLGASLTITAFAREGTTMTLRLRSASPTAQNEAASLRVSASDSLERVLPQLL